MTDTKPDVAELADAIAKRPIVCPWNPFPHDSPWGRRIDQSYLRQLARAQPEMPVVSEHIDWLKIYIEGMTADNWIDMRLRCERQLNELTAALSGGDWRTDIENAPKDGSEILLPLEFKARAFWCNDLKKWILSYPLSVNSIRHPTRYQIPKHPRAMLAAVVSPGGADE